MPVSNPWQMSVEIWTSESEKILKGSALTRTTPKILHETKSKRSLAPINIQNKNADVPTSSLHKVNALVPLPPPRTPEPVAGLLSTFGCRLSDDFVVLGDEVDHDGGTLPESQGAKV